MNNESIRQTLLRECADSGCGDDNGMIHIIVVDLPGSPEIGLSTPAIWAVCVEHLAFPVSWLASVGATVNLHPSTNPPAEAGKQRFIDVVIPLVTWCVRTALDRAEKRFNAPLN